MNITNLTATEIAMLLDNTRQPIEDVEQITSIEVVNKYQASYAAFKVLGMSNYDSCTHYGVP